MEEKNNRKVVVIGAGGHVGFPLSLVLADADFNVVGIDINKDLIEKLNSGIVPYVEDGAEEILKKSIKKGNLIFTDDFNKGSESDVLIIIIGTPIDDNLNPRIDILLNVFKNHKNLLHKNQLIILRSTISPRTTELVKSIIEEMTGMKEGEDFYLVFAPERVLQTKAIKEIKKLPQLIGSFNDESYEIAKKFFQEFNVNKCIKLKPQEAEIGKLITNMARYVSFALANEFYIIADSFDANMHKIIKACNLDYPRLDLPKPGPNVGGPCLYKDGYYLLEKIQFPEIIGTAFKINESIPRYLLNKVQKRQQIKKAGILGMTFKPNCDDTRNSLSYKLRKQLQGLRAEIVEIDPYIPEFNDWKKLKGVDTLILMTPHKEFRDLDKIIKFVNNNDCIIVDMWNFWDENENISNDGIYKISDIRRR